MVQTALIAALLAAPAAAAAAAAVPALELVLMTGRVRVTHPDEGEGAPGEGMPALRPGSEVRVQSGAAWFRSGGVVTVRAKGGDAFRFEADESGLRVAQADEAAPPLEVRVGDVRLLLEGQGELSVAPPADGRVEAVVSAGRAAVLPGSRLRSGEGVELAPGGDAGLIAGDRFSAEAAQGGEPVPGLALLELTRDGDDAFVVHAPSAAAGPGGVLLVPGLPEDARSLAGLLIEKYGSPEVVSLEELRWVDNSPWARSTLRARPASPDALLEQAIFYEVGAGRAAEIEEAGLGVRVDRETGELSAAGRAEPENFLAVNLAMEVAAGRRTGREARRAHAMTLELQRSGKSSPYLEGLVFP